MALSFHREDYLRLIKERSEPNVSIYSPMEPSPSQSEQNQIRYRNLLRTVSEQLGKNYPQYEKRFVATLSELDRTDFWRAPQRGLVVFLSQDVFEFHKLPLAVPELVVVSDSFHTRPLLSYVAANSRYYVLAVSQDHVTLYNGWREFLMPVDTPNLPQHMREVVGEKEYDSQRHSHPAAKGGKQSIYHGSSERDAGNEHEIRTFFTAVDKEACRLLRESGQPVVLAGLAHHQPIYRKVSNVPLLLEDGIACDPGSLSATDLGEKAWALIERRAQEQLNLLLTSSHKAKARGEGGDDLEEIGRNAAQGRVRSLLVDAGTTRWGTLDRSTGEIHLSEAPHAPGSSELLDDLAELVLQRGGEVYVWEGEPTLSPSGVAAIYK